MARSKVVMLVVTGMLIAGPLALAIGLATAHERTLEPKVTRHGAGGVRRHSGQGPLSGRPHGGRPGARARLERGAQGVRAGNDHRQGRRLSADGPPAGRLPARLRGPRARQAARNGRQRPPRRPRWTSSSRTGRPCSPRCRSTRRLPSSPPWSPRRQPTAGEEPEEGSSSGLLPTLAIGAGGVTAVAVVADWGDDDKAVGASTARDAAHGWEATYRAPDIKLSSWRRGPMRKYAVALILVVAAAGCSQLDFGLASSEPEWGSTPASDAAPSSTQSQQTTGPGAGRLGRPGPPGRGRLPDRPRRRAGGRRLRPRAARPDQFAGPDGLLRRQHHPALGAEREGAGPHGARRGEGHQGRLRRALHQGPAGDRQRQRVCQQHGRRHGRGQPPRHLPPQAQRGHAAGVPLPGRRAHARGRRRADPRAPAARQGCRTRPSRTASASTCWTCWAAASRC